MITEVELLQVFPICFCEVFTPHITNLIHPLLKWWVLRLSNCKFYSFALAIYSQPTKSMLPPSPFQNTYISKVQFCDFLFYRLLRFLKFLWGLVEDYRKILLSTLSKLRITQIIVMDGISFRFGYFEVFYYQSFGVWVVLAFHRLINKII